MRGILSLLFIALPLLLGTSLHAQGYPNQAINLVLPYAPGDSGDVAGRVMAEDLAKHLKVPIIPMNRPGAGATTGTDSVVNAKKDGYTILIAPNAALISARILNPETVRYDPFKDLTPLGMAFRSPLVLAVRADAEYKNFRELIEHPRLQPKSRGLLYAMMEQDTQPIGFRIEWGGKTLSVSAAQVYNRNENMGTVTVFRDFTREAEVEKLIAGPGVYICNKCVGLCNDIIDKEQSPSC